MDSLKVTQVLALSIWFNISWAMCVFGPVWLAPVCLVIWLGLATAFKAPLTLIALVALAGLTMDGILVMLDIYQFQQNMMPFWLMVLWVGFAVYLVILRKKLDQIGPFWFVAAMALLAPICYWVGVVSGKLLWPMGITYTYVISALGWLIFSAIIHLTITWPRPLAENFRPVGKINEE